MLGRTWAIAIDITVVFFGAGVTFLVGALIFSRVAQHFIDATANNFIQVTASYVQLVSYHAFVGGLVVAGVSLAFIAVSRFIAH